MAFWDRFFGSEGPPPKSGERIEPHFSDSKTGPSESAPGSGEAPPVEIRARPQAAATESAAAETGQSVALRTAALEGEVIGHPIALIGETAAAGSLMTGLVTGAAIVAAPAVISEAFHRATEGIPRDIANLKTDLANEWAAIRTKKPSHATAAQQPAATVAAAPVAAPQPLPATAPPASGPYDLAPILVSDHEPALISAAAAQPAASPAKAAAPETPNGAPGHAEAPHLNSIGFGHNHNRLDRAALRRIDHEAEILKKAGITQVIVKGHADGTGPASANDQISQQRADAVASRLELDGISVLDSKGVGSREPVQGAPSNSRANRSVTITPLAP